MNVRTMLRTAAAAAAIGVMILSSPAGLALAAPNETPAQSCKRRGYVWDDRFGCHDKTCEYNGKIYGGGTTIAVKVITKDGYRIGNATCNGFTGNWIVFREAASDPSGANPTQSLPSFQPAP